MSYYLSSKNREIINAIEKILRESSADLHLPTESPERLGYILRNAANTKEFGWIKAKYIIKIGTGEVVCKIRAPRINDTPAITIPEQQTETPSLQFFDIASDIIKSITNGTLGESKEYKSQTLNDDEVDRLKSYCELNGYFFNYENNLVKVIRK